MRARMLLLLLSVPPCGCGDSASTPAQPPADAPTVAVERSSDGLPVKTVDAQAFIELYSCARHWDDFYDYSGVKDKYHWLTYHGKEPKMPGVIGPLYRVRCPVSALPTGFPTRKQTPLRRPGVSEEEAQRREAAQPRVSKDLKRWYGKTGMMLRNKERPTVPTKQEKSGE